MQIKRSNTGFMVVSSKRTPEREEILAHFETFEQAREYLACNGNKDANLPLNSHSSGVCQNTCQTLELGQFSGNLMKRLR